MQKSIFILSASIVMAFFSCKKERLDPAPASAINTPISNFFVKNGVSAQTFTINSTAYQTITGSAGTFIYINPNSFVTQSNQPVSGNVTIKLKEVYTKKDMILTGMIPMAGSLPLVSGGEFFIQATQNGEILKLSGSGSVQVSVPTGVTPSNLMNEFYADDLTITDSTGWSTNNDSIIVIQDSTGNGTGNYYYFEIDSMDWINCDYFWNDPAPKTNISVNAGSEYNGTNCVVFMSIDGQNTIGQLYYNNPSYTANGWPTGKAVTFIAISEINGQYYSAFKSALITVNHNETLNLSPTTEAQIIQDLANLP